MKIHKINIKNYKLIKDYEGVIDGKNVYLIGGNGKGKTSFIEAVFNGLRNKNMPEIPITDNGRKGMIEIDLGDFVARTKFKKGKPAEFELENKEYTEESEKFIKSPRSYMERRIGMLDFDINDFMNLSDQKQVEYVAKYMDVSFDDIDEDIEEAFENRKFDKKKLAEFKAQQNYYREEDANKELIDIVAISKEIESETVKSQSVNNVKKGVSDRRTRETEIQAEIAALVLELDGGTDLDGKEVVGIRQEIVDGEAWLSAPENALMSDEDLAEKIQSRDNSTAINAKIQEAKDARRIDEEITKYEKLIDDSNKIIDDKKEEKGKRLSSAISIPELTYSVSDEKFLYNGLPFDKNQTNTASQLIVGMKIASMMLKELKILRVDASLIDKVEFDKVLNWAESEGIELFIELVDREATQLQIKVDE